jgi:signal transduction histidine kinase
MRANSLALRLFLAAAAWTAAILIVTGIVLSSVYRQAVERSFDRRLDVYVKNLIADVASPEDTPPKIGESLGEPLFELPLSGWYWQVTRLDKPAPEVHSSRSLWDSTLPHLEALGVPAGVGGSRHASVDGPEDVRIRMAESTIDLGDDGRYLIAVAGDAAEIEDETAGFNRSLEVTFALLAVVLLLTTLFQVRFGLAPLKRISEGLAAIRSGSAERLKGTFPEEIAPLARETNALIDANREIVERARTHVGNLAHALKTPLSVILNEAAARGNDPLAVKVGEQADMMRDQVAPHLERARIAACVYRVGTVTDVCPVVHPLAPTIEKIHHHRENAK